MFKDAVPWRETKVYFSMLTEGCFFFCLLSATTSERVFAALRSRLTDVTGGPGTRSIPHRLKQAIPLKWKVITSQRVCMCVCVGGVVVLLEMDCDVVGHTGVWVGVERATPPHPTPPSRRWKVATFSRTEALRGGRGWRQWRTAQCFFIWRLKGLLTSLDTKSFKPIRWVFLMVKEWCLGFEPTTLYMTSCSFSRPSLAALHIAGVEGKFTS